MLCLVCSFPPLRSGELRWACSKDGSRRALARFIREHRSCGFGW